MTCMLYKPIKIINWRVRHNSSHLSKHRDVSKTKTSTTRDNINSVENKILNMSWRPTLYPYQACFHVIVLFQTFLAMLAYQTFPVQQFSRKI